MSGSLISSIKIEKLFGLYSYNLPKVDTLSDATILYGDNGIGKSTILKLVFHLLSAANDKGHRTALYRAVFEKLVVTLTTGIVVSAVRSIDSGLNILTLSITRGDDKLAVWRFIPRNSRHISWEKSTIDRLSNKNDDFSDFVFLSNDGVRHVIEAKAITSSSKRRVKGGTLTFSVSPKINPIEGESIYLAALEKHAPVMFILDAERRLDSDAVPDPSDEMELRRIIHSEEPKRINDLVARSREIALSQALYNASRWISRNAILGANQGSTNVHTVYANVLRHVLGESSQKINLSKKDIESLQARFAKIQEKTKELAQYGLQTILSTSEFQKALSDGMSEKVKIVAGLLKPYLESLEARIEALDPLYRTVDRFIRIINDLLSDKTLTFDVSAGFTIKNRLGDELEPSQLSSGEQQLLLLFCYVLTGRDKPSVFMIDEPEISLNIKWQRQLIQSLLEITDTETIQFVFASHSLELLSQHRNRVVRLENLE